MEIETIVVGGHELGVQPERLEAVRDDRPHPVDGAHVPTGGVDVDPLGEVGEHLTEVAPRVLRDLERHRAHRVRRGSSPCASQQLVGAEPADRGIEQLDRMKRRQR